MKSRAELIAAVAIFSLNVSSVAVAQPREGHGEGRSEGRGEVREAHQETRAFAPRPAPGRFQPHPPGAHPHGPIVRPHPVRVMGARVIKRGEHQWRHWEHPEFSRPVYYWDWTAIHSVSCVAEDSYGDQYPVTQTTAPGFGLTEMTTVEDEALDRCYSESGGDQSCYLATCSHY